MFEEYAEIANAGRGRMRKQDTVEREDQKPQPAIRPNRTTVVEERGGRGEEREGRRKETHEQPPSMQVQYICADPGAVLRGQVHIASAVDVIKKGSAQGLAARLGALWQVRGVLESSSST